MLETGFQAGSLTEQALAGSNKQCMFLKSLVVGSMIHGKKHVTALKRLALPAYILFAKPKRKGKD